MDSDFFIKIYEIYDKSCYEIIYDNAFFPHELSYIKINPDLHIINHEHIITEDSLSIQKYIVENDKNILWQHFFTVDANAWLVK